MTPIDRPRTWRFASHLRDTDLSLTHHIALLRDCYRATATEGPLTTRAMVVLPQSIHAVWQLPATVEPLPRWQRFTKTLMRHLPQPVALHPAWVAPVMSEDIPRTVADIHAQPVAWRLVEQAEDWPFSSVHRLGVAA
ncbi:hypothetical protein [Shimia ponticola]|uniref:hypothetical protein n=1 Tax=Shimia ponticola TaxID=2582893 RepID=UPI0011BDA10D|nr:hypothetical protein [Shimia ponticola]